MRNLLLTTMLSLICTMQVYAQKPQDNKVPEKVHSAFNKKFPEAKKVEWEKEGKKEWEAEFELNGNEYSASFRANGNWIETEHEIAEADIPSDIRSILVQNFADYELEEAEVVETSAGKGYEFEVEVGEKVFEVRIDAQGRLSKKKEHKENDEN